jgi:hypothetical protein
MLDDDKQLRFEVSADASGVPTEMKKAADGFKQSAADMEASANKVSATVDKFSNGTKQKINALVQVLRQQRFTVPEIENVVSELRKMGQVTGKLSADNKRMFDSAADDAKRYAAAVTQAAAEIRASGKTLNGSPLSEGQVQRLAQLRANQGPDRTAGGLSQYGSGAFQRTKAQTDQLVKQMVAEQQAVTNAGVKARQEAEASAAKDAAYTKGRSAYDDANAQRRSLQTADAIAKGGNQPLPIARVQSADAELGLKNAEAMKAEADQAVVLAENNRALAASTIEIAEAEDVLTAARERASRATSIVNVAGATAFNAGNSALNLESEINSLGSVEKATEGVTSANMRYRSSEAGVSREIGSGLSLRMKEDAVIRAFQGNLLSGVRAAGAFISNIKGLSAVMSSLFEVVGALAVVGIVVDIADKIGKTVEKIREMPDAVSRGFGALEQSADLSTNELELGNQKIRDRIDLLEKKPVNGLADALIEARVRADELAISLSGDEKAIGNVLKANQIGFFGKLLGKDGTKDVKDSVEGWNNTISNDADAESIARDRGDTKAADAAHDKTKKDLRLAIQSADTDAARRKIPVSTGRGFTDNIGQNISILNPLAGDTLDSSADLNIDKGVAQLWRNRLAQTDAQDENVTLLGQEKAAQNKVKAAENAKNAENAATAAARKKLEAYESQLSDLQQNGNLGANGIYSFWRDKQDNFKGFPNLQRTVENHANEAYRQVTASNNEAIASAGKVPGGFLPNVTGFFGQQVKPTHQPSVTPTNALTEADSERFLHTDSRAAVDYLKTLSQLPAATQKQAIAMQEANLAASQAAGTISRFGAASEQARIHADDYAQSLQRLKEAENNIQLNTAGLTGNEKAGALAKNQQQQSDLSANYAVQSVQDNTNLDETKLTTAWKDSLNRFVQMSQDTAGQIGDIFSDSLGGVNNTLATSLTAYYHTGRERKRALENGLSGDVRNTAQTLAKTGIQKVEGVGLSALGFGNGQKADGSQSKPFWVKVANMVGGSSGSSSSTSSQGGNSPGSAASRVWNTVKHPFGGSGISLPMLSNTGGADPLSLNAPDTSGVADALGANSLDPNTMNSILGGSGFTDSGSTTDSTIGASTFGKVAGGVTGVLGSLIAHLPHFADGGSVTGNMPSVVGERGPELFVPHTAGSIVPNGQWGGNTTHNHSWNVDARGASDPAAVDAAVQRGIRKAAPHLVAASLGAGVDRNKRLPSSRRM